MDKQEIIQGDIVWLDKDHPNKSKVRVVYMTKNGLFSRVHPDELEDPTDKDCYDVMTKRLTKICSSFENI
jgi:myosin-crossreactive antigen